MGLEEVKQEILDKANLEADKIVEEGQQEAEKIMQENEEKINEYKEKSEASTEEIMINLEKREIATAEFEVKKKLLDKKKEIISEVIEEVKEHLTNLDDRQKEDYIKKLIAKAKQEIDVKYVYANPKDKKFVNKVKGVTFKEKEIIGGIIAETADGSISVDYSYEEILGDIKEKSLQEIGSILFEK